MREEADAGDFNGLVQINNKYFGTFLYSLFSIFPIFFFLLLCFFWGGGVAYEQ